MGLQKKDERGVVVRNKARLVAQGHKEEEGINYDEVFAPMARIEAIRLFLAFASFMGFIVYQMDVKSAFLYGTIDKEVYVSQPPSFVDPDHPKKEHGYRRGTIDKTLFIKKDKKDIMLVQVYVDDIIFGSTRKSWCDEFEALMKGIFQMSSIGQSKGVTSHCLQRISETITGGSQFSWKGRRLFHGNGKKQTIVATSLMKLNTFCLQTALWTGHCGFKINLLDYGFNFMNIKIPLIMKAQYV
ncbi:putative ribonuclease H-like domain-containing protein [Tanacetum coccineum]